MAEDPPHLRVLIADDDQRRIAEIAGVVSGFGHTVIAQLLDVSETAEAARREHPDVAIVGVDGQQSHALDLISATVKQAACPVIADIESDGLVPQECRAASSPTSSTASSREWNTPSTSS